MKYEQIKQVFTDLDKLKQDGIWFSGIEGEGEYKEWWKNGQLWTHCFYKQGNKIGEYKRWWRNGQLMTHCFYNGQGSKEGEFKEWGYSRQLLVHCFYRGIKDNYGVIFYQGKNDKRFKGEYKQYGDDGKLEKHIIFNNDGSIKEKIL